MMQIYVVLVPQDIALIVEAALRLVLTARCARVTLVLVQLVDQGIAYRAPAAFKLASRTALNALQVLQLVQHVLRTIT